MVSSGGYGVQRLRISLFALATKPTGFLDFPVRTRIAEKKSHHWPPMWDADPAVPIMKPRDS